jgi:hypothetical protein
MFVTCSRIRRLELACEKRVSKGCACEEGGDECEARPAARWFGSYEEAAIDVPKLFELMVHYRLSHRDPVTARRGCQIRLAVGCEGRRVCNRACIRESRKNDM